MQKFSPNFALRAFLMTSTKVPPWSSGGVRLNLIMYHRPVLQYRQLSSDSGRPRRRRPGGRQNDLVATGGDDPWTPVKDRESGLVYWWNTKTDETTAIGSPKPYAEGSQLAPQQDQQAKPSFLGMVAEGVAFGTGMHLAGRAVSSMFGGTSSSEGDAESSQSSGDDEWDA